MNHGCSGRSGSGGRVAPERRSGSSEGGEPHRNGPSVPEPSRPPAPEVDHRWRAPPLHAAAVSGDVRRVKELLEMGFDPLAQDEPKHTPLHWALQQRHEDVAELLAEEGNDIPERRGRTPLHLAAQEGFLGVMRKLLAAGADVRRQDEDGCTPLHVALLSRREAAADILLDDVANNVQDCRGHTPLHLAALRGYFGIASKLLRSGAHPHLKNGQGLYPLQEALKHEHDDIMCLIVRTCALRGISVDWEEMRPRPDQLRLLRPCVELLSECEAELRRMKEARVEGSRLSFRDVAERHPSRVAPHLRAEVIRRASGYVGSPAHSFPHYADLIAFKLGQIGERRLLLDRCLERFRLLPPLCVDLVLLCLSDRDLRNLARAFENDP